jgi:hypothetical protein
MYVRSGIRIVAELVLPWRDIFARQNRSFCQWHQTSLKKLASTCFLLYCSISPFYSDRTSPGLSSRRSRKSSTRDKSISRTPQRSRVFPFPRLALPTLFKLDQLMRTRIMMTDIVSIANLTD